MFKKKYVKHLFLLTTVIFLTTGLLQANASQVIGDQSTNKYNEVKNLAKDKFVNIMVYDEQGKIDSEFHADGLEVYYLYDENGNMKESKDSNGESSLYKKVKDDSGKEFIEVTEFKNGKIKGKQFMARNDYNIPKMTPEEMKKKDAEQIELGKKVKNQLSVFENEDQKLKSTDVNRDTNGTVTISSTTEYEDYWVNNVWMNVIAYSLPYNSSDKFISSSTNMTEADIQKFFEDKNSILKSTVKIYKKNSSGTVYDTGLTIVPSKAIATAASSYGMNPKVIIATLQKESSLVGAAPGSVAYSSRRFYYAMGYGATDGGDINGTSGFDIQIDKGTKLLKDGWYAAPYTQPVLFNPINNGKEVTSNGVTYKSYIWTKNWGSWSLYKYTPWTLDTAQLPSIGGGNYLFDQVFKGYWSWNWD